MRFGLIRNDNDTDVPLRNHIIIHYTHYVNWFVALRSTGRLGLDVPSTADKLQHSSHHIKWSQKLQKAVAPHELSIAHLIKENVAHCVF